MNIGTFKGLRSIILENDEVICVFLPEYGSKLVSFYDKHAQYEWLFQAKESQLELPNYGADFSQFDSSGFDEVFPSIDKGPHPLDLKVVPDHGEVWSLPWKIVEANDHSLLFSVDSPLFPYTLEKRVKLQNNKLLFEYTASNHGDHDFSFIWTPHALLNFNESTVVEVPNHLKEIMSVEHSTIHLGDWGTVHTYPYTTSKYNQLELNLSQVKGPIDMTSDKYYFTSPLQEGWCRTIQGDHKCGLTYRFPPDKVPYLGVWKTQGGYRGDYNFALEPCTGIYDDVYVADKIKKVSKIPAKGTFSWWFEMESSILSL